MHPHYPLMYPHYPLMYPSFPPHFPCILPLLILFAPVFPLPFPRRRSIFGELFFPALSVHQASRNGARPAGAGGGFFDATKWFWGNAGNASPGCVLFGVWCLVLTAWLPVGSRKTTRSLFDVGDFPLPRSQPEKEGRPIPEKHGLVFLSSQTVQNGLASPKQTRLRRFEQKKPWLWVAHSGVASLS